MENYKEILIDNWEFYVHAINEYNSDEVAKVGISANSKEELVDSVKGLVKSDYESICPDSVDIDDEKELEKYVEDIVEWEGEGLYDIVGFESRDFAVTRIDTILENNLFDIKLDEIVNPELIEKRLKGKIYAVYNKKLKFVVIDDINKEDEGPNVFDVLQDAGVELNNYFYWDNYLKRWYADILRIKDGSLEETFNFLHNMKYSEVDVFYTSEVSQK